jgi:Zn-dependent protease
MEVTEIAYRLFIFFVPFLFALCVHEYAHGIVAKWRGDNTAETMGRLNLNPLSHMDMIGTVMLPILTIVGGAPISFGWAKPVPVNTRNLKKPKTDMFWIALAGPLSNLAMAILTLLLIRIGSGLIAGTEYTESIMSLAFVFVGLNVMLFLFNMIPLNPLDGGKVLARFLPDGLSRTLEDNEVSTSFALLFLLIFFSKYLMFAAHFVTLMLAQLVGVRF